MKEKLSRRRFLRGLGALAAGSAVAACQPQTIIVERTVEVEKEVEKVVTKEVERIVKETVMVAGTSVVVEKVVKETVVVEVAAPNAEDLIREMPGSPDNPRGWKTILPDLPAGAPYPEPVEIVITRRAPDNLIFAESDSVEDNPWSRMIKDLFNIEFKVAWTWGDTAGEAEQKYNLAMASGDMPDYMETVPNNIYVQMVEADLLEDITDAYDAYASPRWKSTWRKYGEKPWVWSRLNGRIYGLPRVEDLAHNDCVMWIRQDWLEKVGMSTPTTLDELHDAAAAFVENGLGQGAEGTTVGIGMSMDWEHTWAMSVDSIWGAHGVIPDHWTEVNGKLVQDWTIKDRMVPALELFSKWYSEGLFRPDFFTMNTWDSWSDVAGNRCGIQFTPSWGIRLESVENDPEAKWIFADIPAGPDGTKMRHTENNFRQGPFCFRKGFERVDAIFEMTNWWLQLAEDPWRRMHGWEGKHYIWEGDKIVSGGLSSAGHWAVGPVGTRGSGFNDPEFVANEIRYRLDEWGKVPPAERDAMQEFVLDDPLGVNQLGMQSRVFILDTAYEGKATELQRPPTETQMERGADLGTLLDEAMIGMIIGERPVSDYDTVYEEWLKLGGDLVNGEVNEWWASR